MGKRFNNFYTVKDIAEKGYTAMELRYVLISGYYRQQLNFTLESLNAARSALQKLAKFDDLIRSYASPGDTVREENIQKPSHVDIGFASFEKAWDSLLSDLNTPQTLGDMFVTVNELESKLKKKEITPELAEKEWLGFRKLLYALGLKLEKKKVETTESAPDEVKQIAEKRWQAKLTKDWAQADVFRLELEAKGWKSLDRKDGYDLVKN
jgi:cysteinyl-tRNA synthetase